jgi:hypothetical protein
MEAHPQREESDLDAVECTGTDITKPLGSDADNYIFRLSMYDRAQAAGLMAYAKKSGTAKIGLLTETTGYGEGGLRDLQELAKIHGLSLLATEKFAVSDTDMTSQLSKMKAAGVETVIVWAQGTPMGLLLRSMEKVNYLPKFLASAAADNITFFDAAGKTLAAAPSSCVLSSIPTPRPRRNCSNGWRPNWRRRVPSSSPCRATTPRSCWPPRCGRPVAPTGRSCAKPWRTCKRRCRGSTRPTTSRSRDPARRPHACRCPVGALDGDKLSEYSDTVTKSLTAADTNR